MGNKYLIQPKDLWVLHDSIFPTLLFNIKDMNTLHGDCADVL